MSSIKNTTKLDLAKDMQMFVCTVNNRANSQNIEQNFDKVMSYNENLIHAGLGSLSPKEIMQMSSLSTFDLNRQIDYMNFPKDFPHPNWKEVPMPHEDACKRLAQIDKHFNDERGAVYNEKEDDLKNKSEFNEIYKQIRILSSDKAPELRTRDPLNKAQHLELVNDNFNDISNKLNERSTDQLKKVMSNKIRNDADIQNRMEVIHTWNKSQDKESLSGSQQMKKDFHQGLKDLVGYKNKQEKAIDDLYNVMQNGNPPMTDKEYRDNIAEKEAEVEAIEKEIKQLDKGTLKEKNKLQEEMKTAEPFGEKFLETQKGLAELQQKYNETMADHTTNLAKAQNALEEAKNAPHQKRGSFIKSIYTKMTDMAVNGYKQTATVTKSTLNIMKDGYVSGKEIVHKANERAKFEGAKAFDGIDRKVANLQIQALQYANDLDRANLNHKKRINNKLTDFANKISNSKIAKNTKKGIRTFKEGFKTLIGRGDSYQYAKDIATIEQAVNHEINLNSRAIADLEQTIAATDMVIDDLQTSQMTKAEKFVQENKEYFKENHLDGIAEDLENNPHMDDKWLEALKDVVNSAQSGSSNTAQNTSSKVDQEKQLTDEAAEKVADMVEDLADRFD